MEDAYQHIVHYLALRDLDHPVGQRIRCPYRQVLSPAYRLKDSVGY